VGRCAAAWVVVWREVERSPAVRALTWAAMKSAVLAGDRAKMSYVPALPRVYLVPLFSRCWRGCHECVARIGPRERDDESYQPARRGTSPLTLVPHMGFGLGHGRDLDDAPGTIGVSDAQLPPLPDDVATNPGAGKIDPRQWFVQPAHPFEIEIGCGKGTFILETAKAHPATNFLGIEWAREFYLYAADRVRRAQLTNVRMLRTDGAEFLRWRSPSSIASVIHLYYSDPWPKRKHHKNRVVQHRFLSEAWRVLMPGGELRIVTDHDELWAWDEAHFAIWTDAEPWRAWREDPAPFLATTEYMQAPPPGLPSCEGAPFARDAFVPPPWVGEGQVVGTNFERKFTGEHKRPHSVVLRKSR
jgi:tRNA (guanine-N7-)-methyltransferase